MDEAQAKTVATFPSCVDWWPERCFSVNDWQPAAPLDGRPDECKFYGPEYVKAGPSELKWADKFTLSDCYVEHPPLAEPVLRGGTSISITLENDNGDTQPVGGTVVAWRRVEDSNWQDEFEVDFQPHGPGMWRVRNMKIRIGAPGIIT